MSRCIDDHDAYDVFHWNLAEPNRKWGLKTRPDRIFTNMIEDLKKRLAGKSIGLQLTDDAKKRLIEKGYDTKNGARPLRREIEDELETLIADAILTGKLNKGDIAKVDFKNDEFSLSIAKE